MIDSKTVKRPALLLLHALLGGGLAQGAEIHRVSLAISPGRQFTPY